MFKKDADGHEPLSSYAPGQIRAPQADLVQPARSEATGADKPQTIVISGWSQAGLQKREITITNTLQQKSFQSGSNNAVGVGQIDLNKIQKFEPEVRSNLDNLFPGALITNEVSHSTNGEASH